MTMPDLWSVLSTPLVELLGWALLHFVWQGAFVAPVLAGALYVLRDHTPTVRHAVSCAALVGLLVLPIGTGLFLSESGLGADAAPAVSVVAVEGTAVPSLSATGTASSGSPYLWARLSAWLQPALPWIVMGWAVGVLLFSLRLAGGAWRVRRLRRTSAPAPEQWRHRLHSLADRIGLRRVPALRISDHVDGPMVAGWWRPVILVPMGLLSGLPPEQVEALLLHELAHVRRHDVLVGRLQAVVETLLFFHPATWWISRQVRRTREACCDDLTVQAGAERIVYVRALLGLAKHALTAPPTAGALAASDGSLLARVRRLVAPTSTSSASARRLSMVVALLLLVAVPLGIAACASQQSTTATEAAEAPSSKQAEALPTPPRAPEAEDPTVVVVQDDSIHRGVTVRGDEAVEIDSLDGGGYVLRYEGERLDTLDVPSPEVPVEPGFFEEELRVALDPDSLERQAHRLQLHSDSLERVLRDRINVDSLERVIQARFDPDSLERVFQKRFDPDSLEHRVLQMRMRADSLRRHLEELRERVHRRMETLREQWEGEMPEQLREQARRLREQAERLEERAEELEARPSPPDSSG